MKTTNPILRQLDDGLIIRAATRRDYKALCDLQVHAFANPDTGELNQSVADWTHDLFRKGTPTRPQHPSFLPKDFLVVEDTKIGALVSCVCLISQTWTYSGIPFGVGRPEIVGTLEAYRRRGLVREQFRILHEWSAARGELVQVIDGIPNYYRQFGYEYAVEQTAIRQLDVPQHIPELKKGERDSIRLRVAARHDLPFIAEMIAQSAARSLVHCPRAVTNLEYEQYGENDPKIGPVCIWNVIETRSGERLGAFMHRHSSRDNRVTCAFYELLPHVLWAEVTPAVIRAFLVKATKLALEAKRTLNGLGWTLVSTHPLFDLYGDRMTIAIDPYAWYVRVPDLSAFLSRIAPVLEQRLAASAQRDYTGTLRLNFYRGGVELTFDHGKLASVQPWRPTTSDNSFSGFGNAGFPDLTFLKLLFGYRSFAELQSMFTDCLVDKKPTIPLLNTLFPKQPTFIWSIH